MRALRVLFVIPGSAAGSSMVFARRQAGTLRRRGLEVECFYLGSRTAPVRLWTELRRFRAHRKQFRPDLVHAHFGTVTALFTVLASGRTPAIITYRGSDLNHVPSANGWRPQVGRLFSQLAALGAARIVCVSQGLKRRLWWRRDRATVLPSGVDTEIFRPQPRVWAREQLGWCHTDPVILFNAGHDRRNKRQDLAEAAFAALLPYAPSARLEVINANVAPDRMPLWMNAADCLLVTSDAEGSPTVVQEALATNLPVVSVDVGDVPDRLRGVTQCSIAARDPRVIARALVKVLHSAKRSNGHLRLRDVCSDHIAGELAHIYREALAETAPQEFLRWNTTLSSHP